MARVVPERKPPLPIERALGIAELLAEIPPRVTPAGLKLPKGLFFEIAAVAERVPKPKVRVRALPKIPKARLLALERLGKLEMPKIPLRERLPIGRKITGIRGELMLFEVPKIKPVEIIKVRPEKIFKPKIPRFEIPKARRLALERLTKPTMEVLIEKPKLIRPVPTPMKAIELIAREAAFPTRAVTIPRIIPTITRITPPKVITKQQQKLIQQQRTEEKKREKILQKQAQKQKQELTQLTSAIPLQQLRTEQRVGIAPTQAMSLVELQKQQQRLGTIFVTTPLFEPVRPPVPIPIPTPIPFGFPFPFPKPLFITGVEKVEAYHPYGRSKGGIKKGRWLKLSRKPLTKSDALARGALAY